MLNTASSDVATVFNLVALSNPELFPAEYYTFTSFSSDENKEYCVLELGLRADRLRFVVKTQQAISNAMNLSGNITKQHLYDAIFGAM